ncbi:MAG: hypothetical protein H7124_17510 [Phycisphaerales bacterium]|nr:hypothetical protein [Hyphomonadaceae bacterium]
MIDQLLSVTDDLWLLALIGSFFVMVCEAAKPKPREGESKAAASGFALLIMLMSLVTPLLLLFHAFASGAALFGILILLCAVVVGSAIIGMIIGAAAPDVGRTLNKAAPVLAVPVFALAFYVSWRSVVDVVNFLVATLVR